MGTMKQSTLVSMPHGGQSLSAVPEEHADHSQAGEHSYLCFGEIRCFGKRRLEGTKLEGRDQLGAPVDRGVVATTVGGSFGVKVTGPGGRGLKEPRFWSRAHPRGPARQRVMMKLQFSVRAHAMPSVVTECALLGQVTGAPGSVPLPAG